MLPLPAGPPEPTIASLRHDGESLALYWTFYWAVASAQLARWLPRKPSHVLDLSGPDAHTAARAVAAGHHVIELRDPSGNVSNGHAPQPPPPNGNVSNGKVAATAVAGHGGNVSTGDGRGHGTLHPVIADSESLACLADTSLDAVIADDRALSRHLATEATVAEIARVLRPGGRLFFSVDSLTLGMAILAEQNYWAHLSDVPAAELLLIPWPDGTITRCFQADQLRELLTGAGLEVEWIRPRTALSPSTVEHILTGSPKALSRLVRTELTAPLGDESLGIHLLASARRPGPHFDRN